jgi:hypothetical protein
MGVRNANIIVAGKPKAKRPLGNLGIDARIILKYAVGKWGWNLWMEFI